MSEFVSRPEYYAQNTRQATILSAGNAILTTPQGEREPAVVLHSKGKIHGVLPIAEAIRLANQVADAIQAAKQVTP